MSMKIYGLVGYPLEHSFSPSFFKNLFASENITDAEYRLFAIKDISLLPDIINKTVNLEGLNITIPYKKAVIPFLDSYDETVKLTGASNTIKIERCEGKTLLHGFNTDFMAFSAQINALFSDKKLKKALILGTGGAASTANIALKAAGAQVFFASRNPKSYIEMGYHEINREFLSDTDLVVNTTPLGMWPDINSCPDFPFNLCKNNTVFFDLIYNPEETLFMKKAGKIGAIAVNGLNMLHMQAMASWNIWRNIKF